MEDREVMARISELVEEEHRLREHAGGGHALSADDRQRLSVLEEQLDQCWDLLRRRRAREEAGADPDVEEPRPIPEVESYLQ